MLMAKHPLAQRKLSALFEQQLVQKRYLAVVRGAVSPLMRWSRIDKGLSADWPNRPKQKTDDSGKPSITDWRALLRLEEMDATLLEVKPRSGRTHQIRVHLQSVGLPILGDSLYEVPQEFLPQEFLSDERPHIESTTPAAKELEHPHQRMFLHADQIIFTHPFTQFEIKLTQPAQFLSQAHLQALQALRDKELEDLAK